MIQVGPEIRTWLPKPQGPTLKISAANALHPERADLHCDTTHAEVQIQEAIDELDGVSYGEILLSEGDFLIQGVVSLPSTDRGIILRGSGWRTTVTHNSGTSIFDVKGAGVFQGILADMRLFAGTNVYGFDGRAYLAVFSGLMCDGFGRNPLHFLNNLDANATIEKCFFSNNGVNTIASSGAFWFEGTSSHFRVFKCFFAGNYQEIYGGSVLEIGSNTFGDMMEAGADRIILASGENLQLHHNRFFPNLANVTVVKITGGGTFFKGYDISHNIFQPAEDSTSPIIDLGGVGDLHQGVIGPNIFYIPAAKTIDSCIRLNSGIKDLKIGGNNAKEDGTLTNGFVNVVALPTKLVMYNKYCDLFMDVVAVAANHVVNGQTLAADPTVCALAAQPDVPRTLSWALTHPTLTAFTLEIIGINAKGQTVTETFTDPAWTGETLHAYAVVTSITMKDMTGNLIGDSIDVGITDVLGLSNIIYETGDVYKIKKNTLDQVVAAGQLDTTYHTYDMQAIGLAVGDDFTIWFRSNLNVLT